MPINCIVKGRFLKKVAVPSVFPWTDEEETADVNEAEPPAPAKETTAKEIAAEDAIMGADAAAGNDDDDDYTPEPGTSTGTLELGREEKTVGEEEQHVMV